MRNILEIRNTVDLLIAYEFVLLDSNYPQIFVKYNDLDRGLVINFNSKKIDLLYWMNPGDTNNITIDYRDPLLYVKLAEVVEEVAGRCGLPN